VWYAVKVLHIGHILLAVTETLSLTVYNSITMRFVGDRLPVGGGVQLGLGCGTP